MVDTYGQQQQEFMEMCLDWSLVPKSIQGFHVWPIHLTLIREYNYILEFVVVASLLDAK